MIQIHKGLDGIVADKTSISKIDLKENRVLVRGYSLTDLAENLSFEQVAYLLIEGKIPDLETAEHRWRSSLDLRPVPEAILKQVAQGKDPSLALTATMAFFSLETNADSSPTLTEMKELSWKLLAQIPYWVACLMRPLDPLEKISESFLTGQNSSEAFLRAAGLREYSSSEIRIFEKLRILYCEHGFNAASFSVRTTASTLNDFYSSIVSGMACLKGDNHGGAIRLILPMLENAIKEGPSAYIKSELALGHKISGFGHRIYKATDSRFPTIFGFLDSLSKNEFDRRYLQCVEETMLLLAQRKNIYPNLELASAPTLRLFGISTPHMVNFISMGRAAGWCAHAIEQFQNNRIIRPDSLYVGPEPRNVVESNNVGEVETFGWIEPSQV